MFRKPLVDERVIRRQQIEDAAVFVYNAAEEQFRLALKRVPQVVIEIRKYIDDRLAGFQRAYVQPLAGEVAYEGFGFRIRHHSANLLFEHDWIFEPALRGEIDQLVIGHAAPQEEGQP